MNLKKPSPPENNKKNIFSFSSSGGNKKKNRIEICVIFFFFFFPSEQAQKGFFFLFIFFFSEKKKNIFSTYYSLERGGLWDKKNILFLLSWRIKKKKFLLIIPWMDGVGVIFIENIFLFLCREEKENDFFFSFSGQGGFWYL